VVSLKLRPIRGSDLVKIFCNRYGFSVVRRKGSHATLNKGPVYVTIPLKQIGVGLLSTILRDSGIPREEFLRLV